MCKSIAVVAAMALPRWPARLQQRCVCQTGQKRKLWSSGSVPLKTPIDTVIRGGTATSENRSGGHLGVALQSVTIGRARGRVTRPATLDGRERVPACPPTRQRTGWSKCALLRGARLQHARGESTVIGCRQGRAQMPQLMHAPGTTASVGEHRARIGSSSTNLPGTATHDEWGVAKTCFTHPAAREGMREGGRIMLTAHRLRRARARTHQSGRGGGSRSHDAQQDEQRAVHARRARHNARAAAAVQREEALLRESSRELPSAPLHHLDACQIAPGGQYTCKRAPAWCWRGDDEKGCASRHRACGVHQPSAHTVARTAEKPHARTHQFAATAVL
jgi:hypothetical protein